MEQGRDFRLLNDINCEKENAGFVTIIKYIENSFSDVLDRLKLGEPRYSDYLYRLVTPSSSYILLSHFLSTFLAIAVRFWGQS